MAITPEMIRLADAFRIALLARERTASTLLVRRYGAIWQAMQAQILDLTEQATKLRAAGKDVEKLMQELDAMRQLQAQVRAELGKFVGFSADTIEAGQARAILAGERDAYQLTLAGFPRGATLGIRMQRMPAGAVNALVGYLADGSPLNKLLTEAMGEAADRMFDTMLASLARGDNPRVLARAMRDDFGMGLTRALRIARTEQLRAYRTASLHQYRESNVVVGWERRAAHDERTCMACIMLDGTVYSLDTPMADHPQGRCVMLPHTKAWAEMGLSQREPGFQRTLGKDWFQQQPEAVQRKMMGALYEPWKAGKFQLSDIPGLRKDATWGDSWMPKSLKELMNASSAVS